MRRGNDSDIPWPLLGRRPLPERSDIASFGRRTPRMNFVGLRKEIRETSRVVSFLRDGRDRREKEPVN